MNVGNIVTIIVSILTCLTTIITVSRKIITREELKSTILDVKEDIRALGTKFDTLDGRMGQLRERVAVLEEIVKYRKE